MSDERGRPRVISCALRQRCGLRRRQPLEMRAVHEARAFTTGSAIKPTTALAKKILQKDFWRRGGAAEIITTSAPARLYAKFGVRRRSDPEESAARHSNAKYIQGKAARNTVLRCLYEAVRSLLFFLDEMHRKSAELVFKIRHVEFARGLVVFERAFVGGKTALSELIYRALY